MGECLAGCQYAHLTRQQARDVMKKVTARPLWYPELATCIRCGKCDHRCPNDAHPSSLMRECLEHKRRAEPEHPASMLYGINGLGLEGWGPNFFKDVYKGFGKPERMIFLATRASPSRARTSSGWADADPDDAAHAGGITSAAEYRQVRRS